MTVTFHKLIWTQRDPPSPICLSIHSSLQAFFTETFGIFFPSTMMNTVLTSVLGWNWGAHKEEGHTQREQMVSFFLMCFVFLFFSVRASPQRPPNGLRFWRFFILICQNILYCCLHSQPAVESVQTNKHNFKKKKKKDKWLKWLWNCHVKKNHSYSEYTVIYYWILSMCNAVSTSEWQVQMKTEQKAKGHGARRNRKCCDGDASWKSVSLDLQTLLCIYKLSYRYQQCVWTSVCSLLLSCHLYLLIVFWLCLYWKISYFYIVVKVDDIWFVGKKKNILWRFVLH